MDWLKKLASLMDARSERFPNPTPDLPHGTSGPLPQRPREMQEVPRQLRVMPMGGMQPFGRSYEDEYTPQAALGNTGYFNPQTTQNGVFRQQGAMPMQGILDPMDASRNRRYPRIRF